jgi:hypothetical protein
MARCVAPVVKGSGAEQADPAALVATTKQSISVDVGRFEATARFAASAVPSAPTV